METIDATRMHSFISLTSLKGNYEWKYKPYNQENNKLISIPLKQH